MSIAGGFEHAVQRAAEVGCQCLQLFTRNTNQWRARPIQADEPARFQAALALHAIRHTAAHASYLINLASPDDSLWRRSIDGLRIELARAQLLGIPYVILHPGAHMGQGDDAGLRRVVRALDEVDEPGSSTRPLCLLENTAGQGTTLGWRPEHLATILQRVRSPGRLGVCIDTCHLFAAGYALARADAYRRTIEVLRSTVGLGPIKVFHLNDSQRDRGSRIDRHEHIGRGRIGLQGFRRLLCDDRFQHVPMYLETPKGCDNGQDLDLVNLRTLRELAG
jgi:deoxyribonuclease-4